MRESLASGKVKLQKNSPKKNFDEFNNVNYESEGDEVKLTFPEPSGTDKRDL